MTLKLRAALPIILALAGSALGQTTTTYHLIDAPQNFGRAFGNSFRVFNIYFDNDVHIYWIQGQTSPGYKTSCGTDSANGTGFLFLDLGDEALPCINATSFTLSGQTTNGRCTGPASATEVFSGFDENNVPISGSVTFNFTYVYKSGGGGRGGGGAGCYTYGIDGSLSVTR